MEDVKKSVAVEVTKLSSIQKNFLGFKITTPKGSTLLVDGVYRRKGKYLYHLTCDICSADSMMYPKGTILSLKSNLLKDPPQIPCGCAANPWYTETQYITAINRKLAKTKYEFIGWEGGFKRQNSKFKILDIEENRFWINRHLHLFLATEGIKDPYEHGRRTWSKKEREIQMKTLLNNQSGLFLQWVSGYENKRSSLSWRCKEGHINTTNVQNVVAGRGCPTCSFKREGTHYYCNFLGYYPYRKEEDDYLYVVRFNNTGEIKVGRSFDFLRRLFGGSGLKSKAKVGLKQIELLEYLTSDHETVYKVEQRLHKALFSAGFGVEREDAWSIELFKEEGVSIVNTILAEENLTKSPEFVINFNKAVEISDEHCKIGRGKFKRLMESFDE